MFHLPVLAGIAPAVIRRKAATFALALKAVKRDWHILHDTTSTSFHSYHYLINRLEHSITPLC